MQTAAGEVGGYLQRAAIKSAEIDRAGCMDEVARSENVCYRMTPGWPVKEDTRDTRASGKVYVWAVEAIARFRTEADNATDLLANSGVDAFVARCEFHYEGRQLILRNQMALLNSAFSQVAL